MRETNEQYETVRKAVFNMLLHDSNIAAEFVDGGCKFRTPNHEVTVYYPYLYELAESGRLKSKVRTILKLQP